ncbi:unnamed protein product [Ambrosiozyma monospora]|uniref:Unnamed protein product n=1 Tax=Ambrosiozyma monospora TaxID=43982 RepID=A0ACB5TRP0_AMBMO|nr:unnamed protein product [Ambrosiozyma monospora]
MLGLLHGEIQKDPVGRKATIIDVTNEEDSEECFTPENLQQKRDEMARKSLNVNFPTPGEQRSASTRHHYWGVNLRGRDVTKTLTNEGQVEELQSSVGGCTTIWKLSWDAFMKIFEPVCEQPKNTPDVVL